MDTVMIPADVLKQLRETAATHPNELGYFSTGQYMRATGWGKERVKRHLRKLKEAGKLESRRFSWTAEEADAMGMLGASGATMHRVLGDGVL